MTLLRGGMRWLVVGAALTVLVSGLGLINSVWTGAQQQEIEVCPRYQGSCPYTSIAAAVRDAPDGATIVIWPASYNEPPMDITKALTFKVKKRGLVSIFPTLGGRYNGLFRIAVGDKNKWVSFLGDSESNFDINGGSDVKLVVFYIKSNARFASVAVSGRGSTEAVIFAELWEDMRLEFVNGQIGGGKVYGLVNQSSPKSWVQVKGTLVNVNAMGIRNLTGSVDVNGNSFISNDTGVYAGETSDLGRAWIENNSFEKNGWGIFAKTEYNIVRCRNNTFKNNTNNMNDVAAQVCS